MFVFTEIDLPANTPETAPIETTIPIPPGIIDFIEVSFPSGCVRLARLRVFYHTVQIVPYNGDQSLAYDDYVSRINLGYEVTENPTELLIKSWNLDDTYTHQLTIGINIVPKEPISLDLALQGAPIAKPTEDGT